jgi:hypothetical protein
MNKTITTIGILVALLATTFGAYQYLDRFALAEDMRTMQQKLQQSDFCMMKELRLISVRNDLRDYNLNYGKDCARCDDKQKEDYSILLEEKEMQKKALEVCK